MRGEKYMRISEIKRLARLSLKGNWKRAILLTIITIIVTPAVDKLLSGGIETTIFASVVSPLIIIPFTVAVSYFYIELYRNENPQMQRIFMIYKEWKFSLKLIGTTIIMWIFIVLWSLLLFIPGIIKGLAYSQTSFILKDNPDLSPLEAITESRKRMHGLKWKFFLLNLSFIGWMILCIPTLGIGYLWLIPYITSSLAAFYQELIHLPYEPKEENFEISDNN
jgi:uncharacterized membrane protein